MRIVERTDRTIVPLDRAVTEMSAASLRTNFWWRQLIFKTRFCVGRRCAAPKGAERYRHDAYTRILKNKTLLTSLRGAGPNTVRIQQKRIRILAREDCLCTVDYC